MTVFILTFVIVVLAIVALAVGLLLGRGPLRSSCGGDSLIRLCQICAERKRR